ncbi:MAG: hypothetical protein GF355_04070, partial [Candidatus Eisenbacteria bacterium]|nr:hypothetical protein [Candidatus Eisenbacteria bacterium]
MHSRFKSVWWVVAGLMAATPALAAGPLVPGGSPLPQTTDVDQTVDANSLEMYVTNLGSFGHHLRTGNPGGYFPRGTTKSVIFASGLWIGAQVEGEDGPRVAIAEYTQEFSPGVIQDDGTPSNAASSRYRVYKIQRGDTTSDDYLDWPFADGAPADASDPGYDPNDPQTWKPLMLGDQSLWCVYNDADPAEHTAVAGNTAPLGLEVRQTVFAFDRQPPLGNMVFLKFEIINKGDLTLDSTYVSLWSDPDIGGYTDDLVGCDTDLSLGFCYNSTNDDELYGSAPPAVGYDFFKGPANTYGIQWPPGSGTVPDELPMTSFNKYINGTDPYSAGETYNYMRGLDIDGNPVVNEVTGETTTFFNSGDPVTGEGWLDTNPADRRFMLSAGPFQMAPGDTQEVVAGIIVAQGTDRLNSVSLLRQYDEQAQAVFDLDFNIPAPPPRPSLY